MTKSATPFLMFQDGRAEEAMNLYVSLFSDSSVTKVTRHPEGAPNAGKIILAEFNLVGRPYCVADSPIRHAFDFTPSLSIFVECASGEELRQVFATLSEGGQVLMPLDNYGFSERFGWVNDRYKVSWQLNFAG